MASVFQQRFEALVPQLKFVNVHKGKRKGMDVANRYQMLVTVVRSVATGTTKPFGDRKETSLEIALIGKTLHDLELGGQKEFELLIQKYETLRFQESDGLIHKWH